MPKSRQDFEPIISHCRSIWELWSTPRKYINCIINPGLLPTGGIMVITGEPGIGKSFLAQQTSFEIASGKRWLNLYPTTKSSTVYLELEKRSPIAEDRFLDEQWKNYYSNKTSMKLYYYNSKIPFLDTKTGTELLKEIIDETSAKTVVVDAFTTTLLDETENANIKRALLNYRDLAQSLEVSFIMIQHLIKRATAYDEKQKKWEEAPLKINDLKGSKFLQYEVDTVLGITIAENKERELIFLKHSFCPYQLLERFPLRFKFLANTISPFSFPNSKVLRLLSILEACPDNTSTSSELEKLMGITRPTLNNLIDITTNAGVIGRITGGGRGNEVTLKLITNVREKVDIY